MTTHSTDPLEPRRTPPVRIQLLALGSAVAFLVFAVVGGNVLHHFYDESHESNHPVFSNAGWNGRLDGSHAELVGYVFLIFSVAFLLATAAHRKIGVYAAWGAVAFFLLLDDSLQVHERIGRALTHRFKLPEILGLRGQDLGEIIVWGALGLFLGALVVIAHVKAPNYARRDSYLITGAVFLIGIFAVLLDLLDIAIFSEAHVRTQTLVGLAETAGEVASMGLLLVASFWIMVRR